MLWKVVEDLVGRASQRRTCQRRFEAGRRSCDLYGTAVRAVAIERGDERVRDLVTNAVHAQRPSTSRPAIQVSMRGCCVQAEEAWTIETAPTVMTSQSQTPKPSSIPSAMAKVIYKVKAEPSANFNGAMQVGDVRPSLGRFGPQALIARGAVGERTATAL